ncbi:ATP synthase complex subunit H-domain-containing protein [Crepidotus variabilis]|uniref:ATP synthase complex subunit H-domain-containing protein n=1 Tax=Crepidotus variabilis TaxID=179855 RepID=A0A9P6EB95_9AGAR|nr:ATP synthase complex subunit H-domain-containing protein [Crepidotus variabilis]
MSSILRQASGLARQASRARTFTTSAVARKDLVQDLYVREIKAYKPAAVAKDAHVGSVKQLSLPTSPKAPALPTDLASELSAYDAAEPTIAEATGATTAKPEDGVKGADAFLNFLEQDLPKPVEHHH